MAKTTRNSVPTETSLTFEDVLSDDGTRIRTWTNDLDGARNRPTVVLFNGLGTSPYAWPALLDPGCGVRVVSWNHRGVGGSARPEDPTRVGVTEFVEDALSVMDHYGIGKAVLMGWSIGVNTMFELALRHPERVSGLFAVCGVPGNTFATMLSPLHIPHWVAKTATVNLSRLLRTGGFALTPITSRLPVGERTVNTLARTGFMLAQADPSMSARAIRDFLSTPVDWYFHLALKSSEHARVSLSTIAVPAFFVAGTYDLMAGARAMKTAAARMQEATYVELRTSHFAQLERPGEVHQLLVEFLERIG